MTSNGRGGRKYLPFIFTEQGIAMLSGVLRSDIAEHDEPKQKILFNGQIYDAYSLLVSLIKKAKKEIILIDGYVDVAKLTRLSLWTLYPQQPTL